MEVLAVNIARLRRERGFTQEELAGRLCVSPQAVSKWENGQSLPDLTLLPVLADQLRVSVDALLGHVPVSGRHTVYEERYQPPDLYWGESPNDLSYEVLRLCPPTRPVRLLDIGCGEGRDAIFFARNGYAVTAFDASETGLAKARRRAEAVGVEIDFFQADLLTFRPEGVFDIIFASGTLHYLGVERRRDVMIHYQAHTAPGGFHALNVFASKPYIPPAPDEESPTTLWRTGELAGLYADWGVLRMEERTFDCDSGGVPHRHCMDTVIARKPV